MIEILTIFQNIDEPRGQIGDAIPNRSVNRDQDPIIAVRHTQDVYREDPKSRIANNTQMNMKLNQNLQQYFVVKVNIKASVDIKVLLCMFSRQILKALLLLLPLRSNIRKAIHSTRA